jgi:hypothetical protein
MSQQSSGPAGPGNDDWPDELWPGDDDPPGSGGPDGGAPPGPRTAPGWPGDGPPERRSRPFLLLVTAILAAAAGAAIVLGVHGLSGSSGVTAGPAGQPSSLTPVAPGGNGLPVGSGALPGTGSGGTGALFVAGKVTAVSGTSITVEGPGHTVTAAVTRSTRITGKVSGISGIKAGDQVSAQIVQNGGAARATAIQDPAQPPAGGTLP